MNMTSQIHAARQVQTDANRALLDWRERCEFLGFDEGIYEAVRHLSP